MRLILATLIGLFVPHLKEILSPAVTPEFHLFSAVFQSMAQVG